MNNRLLAVMLPEDEVRALLHAAERADPPLRIAIDVDTLTVRTQGYTGHFALSERHRRMFLDGLDLVGSTLARREAIEAFAERLWAAQPWLRDVARRTRDRLDATPAS